MAEPDALPEAPEPLFAEYHRLRSSVDATAAAYDALAKRTRAAMRAMRAQPDFNMRGGCRARRALAFGLLQATMAQVAATKRAIGIAW
jgi:hypothetical protein